MTLLTACGAGDAKLSNVRASTDAIVPGSWGVGRPLGVVEVRYTLRESSLVTIHLDGPVSATLLSDTQGAGEHVFRFTGVVEDATDANGYMVVRRAVPDGEYRITVSVSEVQESVSFRVSGSNAQPPAIESVVVKPETISPNSDAVDDVAEVTFRTNQTATLSVELTDQDGALIPALAAIERGPGEQSVVVNGRALTGDILPDGSYTLTIRVQNEVGNRSEVQRPLTIQGGGEPALSVLKVEISPRRTLLGESIAVTVTVKNVGDVPLRTQGPDPGYTYTTNDSYSSIEDQRWTDKAGLWRVGVDWDGNSGGAGPYRYPFRWGFGKTLMPGETVTTGGRIVILKQESRMWFYAGVLQEGIRIVHDRLGRTLVEVDF